MILKHKKILIGGVIAAVTIGTLTGILVPILNKQSQSDDKKKLSSYESLVAKIIAAKDEQEAKNQTMKLYGLELKNDDAILSLGDSVQEQYDAALTLGKYIFANKDDYKIRVYEGKDANALKQLLLVFKLKTATKVSQDNSDANWPTNKIDTSQDEFAFLHTIFKNKFVHGEFENGKLDSAPENFVSNFKTQEYEMLKLYFAFKTATPSQEDFSTYNMANDTNAFAIATIKNYIISLVSETALLSSDLESNILFTPNPGSASEGLAQGTIAFKYGDLEDITKVVKFTYIQGYNIEIADGSEAKVADEIKPADVVFSDTQPPNIAIGGVEVSTKVNDGTRVKVTFTGSNGVTPLVVSQGLGGFTSYQDKAWKIVDGMNGSDFKIATAGALASVYDKNGILSLIYAKIDELLDDTFQAKVRNAVVISNITLTPNNIIGSLLISINLGSNLKEFLISGFSTQANEDSKSVAKVKAAIDGIGAMTKTTSVDIIPVSSPQALDADAFRTLTGLVLPDDVGITLTYTHEGISADGNLEISVVISKETASDSTIFTVAISGINRAKAQAKINSFNALPTLKPGASTKTAKNVIADDLEAPTALDLIITITRVTKSTITTDGSVVMVTITVFSTVADTTARTYNVELSGFMTEATLAEFVASTQTKIDNFNSHPTLKPGASIKTTKNVTANDLEAPSALDLIITITRVTKSIITIDGSVAMVTIRVASSVEGTTAKTYDVELPGFMTEVEFVAFRQTIQTKIDNFIAHPTLKPGASAKTAENVSSSDLEAPLNSDDDLIVIITRVIKSTITANGSVAMVTIRVSSNVEGTTAKTYDVELPGFMTEVEFVAFRQTIQTKIDNFIAYPTLKPRASTKTAKDVTTNDLEERTVLDLIITITRVTKSIITTDGSVVMVTITVSSNVEGTTARTHDVELPGFMTEVEFVAFRQTIQTKIDNFNSHPTLKPGASTKTAKNVSSSDLEAPLNSDGDLTATITRVTKSIITTDGSVVMVTITVSSNVEGTTARTYDVELPGFMTETFVVFVASTQTKIDNFIASHPTLKPGASTKTAKNVIADDLEAPTALDLRITIVKVIPSYLSPDGSIVNVTLKIFSNVKGTIPSFVSVELAGFTKEPIDPSKTLLASFDFVANKPTLKSGVNTKTAVEVTKEDLVLPIVSGLKFEIFEVIKSISTPDGSTVVAFLEVSSVGKPDGEGRDHYRKYYRRGYVKVSGFTVEADPSKQDSRVQVLKDVSKVYKWFLTKLGASPWPFSAMKPSTFGWNISTLKNRAWTQAKHILEPSPALIGYPSPPLPSGVIVHYSFANKKTRRVIIEATISKAGANNKIISFLVKGFYE